jgi:Ni/Co efflux regulator RcnB
MRISQTAMKMRSNLLSHLRQILLVLIIFIPLFGAAQDSNASKSQKKAEKKKEQRVEDAKKAELKGKKRHMKIQEKKVRKRMKKNKKKGGSYVSRRPGGFFKGLFKPFR